MKILLAGGAGFIGSHTVVELIQAGHEPVVVDNLYNSNRKVFERLKAITGKDVCFYEADVCDVQAMDDIFAREHFDAVIQFAGYKAVPESVRESVKYYRNNLDTTLTLLECMQRHGVTRIVFSSSATVYGPIEESPLVETMPSAGPTNPYAWSKYMNEVILRDAAVSNPGWSVALLRYFNPIGAHESGLIGENPLGIPNNLMPYVTQVAVGKLPYLNINGTDFPTPDGTGVRDYIHVVDLARGHVKAVEYALAHTGSEPINLGTGRGYSVLELVNTFQNVNGVPVPYRIAPRRAGDIATCYSDPSKAALVLGWKAELDLAAMCRDSWRWQSQNPRGYEE